MRLALIRAKFCSSRGWKAGYTLIEMAIVVSVVGLLMASFISAYNIYKKTSTQIATENNASLITAELGKFLIQHGRYPCPAQLDLPRTDARYGMETECDPLVTAAVAAAAVPPGIPYPAVTTAGTCAGGLCFENGQIWVDVNQSPTNICAVTGPTVAGSCVVPKVRRGALPFRTLGIPEDQAEDGYGNRFIYAVTENLAVTTSYVRRSGGISVLDGRPVGQLLTPADNRAHYIIFSPGPDRAGAVTRYGVQVNACPAAGYDAENCTTNLTGTNNLAIYRAADYSTAPGATHFDDYVKFFSSVETPLWRISDAGGFHIRDLIDAEAGGQVGIGKDVPATNASVDVVGEVRADNADTHAAQICDLDPTNPRCIPTSKFGGEADDFKCPAGTYARAFGERTNPTGDPATDPAAKYIKCVADTPESCPTGETMIGIDFSDPAYPQGKPRCSSVVTCPASTKTLCSGAEATTFTIPSNVKNSTWVSPVAGSSRQRTYVCQTNGSGVTSWQTLSTTGSCSCTAIDQYFDTTCNVWQGNGNWTGVVTQHQVHLCPANTGSTTVTSNTCVCAPTSETRTVACPAGLTGSVTQQRDWICDSATAGHWTAWTQVASTCTCTPNTQTQVLGCGTGYTGAINQHRDFTCPAATWGSWVTDSNTCTCTGGTENRTISCPPNEIGGIDQTRTYDCGTNSWGPWVQTASSCTCPAGITQNQTIGCPGAHQAGNIVQQRSWDCPSSSWGPWTDITNTCACVADSETRTVACTAPLLGNITEQRTYDCGAGNWGAWIEVMNNCGTVAYSWVPKTSATGPFGAPLSIQSSSSCSTPGSNSSCSAPAGGGQYWHYAQCQCE